jgi:hypothetical protein
VQYSLCGNIKFSEHSTGVQGELVYDVYLWLCLLLGKVTIFL